MPDSEEPLGARVARLRVQRGYSQLQFARKVSRSVAWLSQVERGVRHIDKMSMLETLAEALDVSLADLGSGVPVIDAQSTVDEVAESLKLVLLTTGLAVGALDQCVSIGIDHMSDVVEETWQLVHAGEFGDLPSKFEQLITTLSDACKNVDAGARPWELLASAYQAMAAACAQAGAGDAAWIAGDRAIQAAAMSGDPLAVGASAFRLAVVFQSAKQFAYVEQTARLAAERVHPLAAEGCEAARSIWGALTLQRAVAASRVDDAQRAYALLADARTAAEIVGPGRNDGHTEFGPLNVAVHEVAIAVELGDAGHALRVAEAINVDALSAERRSRLLIDVARARMQRRDGTRALEALLSAERLAPDHVRGHHRARLMISDLLALTEQPTDDLKDLARRIGMFASRH